MTAQEKALQLCQDMAYTTFGKDFNNGFTLPLSVAKHCALIAVNEIINANPHSNPFNTDLQSTMEYWQQVKTEIEKL